MHHDFESLEPYFLTRWLMPDREQQMALEVKWSSIEPYVPHGSSIGRFGHSITAVDARDEWGTELLVLYGGVIQPASPTGDQTQPENHHQNQSQQHVAVGDVLVLQVDSDIWFAPEMAVNLPHVAPSDAGWGQHSGASSPRREHGALVPGPRAFHAAAAVGRRVYVFGGHVLTHPPHGGDVRLKQRAFYADLWCIDTVRQTNQPSSSSTVSSIDRQRAMACSRTGFGL